MLVLCIRTNTLPSFPLELPFHIGKKKPPKPKQPNNQSLENSEWLFHDWVSGLYLNIQEIDSPNQPFLPTAKNMRVQLYSQSKLLSTAFIIHSKPLH